jgi:hypothetical protein
MKIQILYRNSCSILVAFFAIIFVGCSTGKFVPPEPIPDDRQPIPSPEEKDISIVGDVIEKQFSYQIKQSLDFSRQLRNVFGQRKQAMNVDAFGEVANSSWFTNRNAQKRMSPQELAKGPDTGDGPNTNEPWTVIRAKAEGVTPGIHIRDGSGVGYVIKFEPIGYSELNTGAEVVSTKLFCAAGYHVPENYIVYFDPNILKLGEDVKFTDEKGRRRLMNRQDLEEILARVHHLPDGRIRAVASKYINGSPMGPFKYKGTRKDDPNDIIPHEHRRELRGLRVFAAWLNHFDTKANNSYDAYDDAGYVKHYLLDFGSTLGSNGDEPMPPEIGFENSFDPHRIFLNTITVGAHVKAWEKQWNVPYRSIGHYESKNFHPQKYKFIVPNPAFENMTNLDGYWGAKLVMSFTDEQLRAAVETGQYSDPEAAEYLLQTLIERRDIVGTYWFGRMAPLDNFELHNSSSGKQELCFEDLAVETGLERSEGSQYRWELRTPAGVSNKEENLGNSTCIPLPVDQITPKRDINIWEISLRLKRGRETNWSKRVTVYLQPGDSSGKFSLLGVKRQE